MLTVYCSTCDNIERYLPIKVVDGILDCTNCNAEIIIEANTIIYHKAKTSRFTAYEEQHSKGFINIDNVITKSDLGIVITDGKVCIFIDSIPFLQFKPSK